MDLPTRLDVEVALEACSSMKYKDVQDNVSKLLLQCNTINPGVMLTSKDFPDNSPLQGQARFIQLCETKHDAGVTLNPASIDYVFHVYKPDTAGASKDTGNEDSETVTPSTHWTLPCEEFMGLWESLIFETNIKDQLLRFVETAALYSEKGVNPKIINWNRVVLLHGPPGTGKTTLCKALAQKLSIRLDGMYQRTHLVEINSHSLFSKWFSESGKLVMKMFDKIKELAEDPQTLVCVLIDEVESLTHARKSAMNGLEPSDSIRVVNAVLTQIDHMQRFPNVLTLTTSNLTGAVDLAFVDRADIKTYIGLPSIQAIYQIYSTCLNELMDTGIITQEYFFTYQLLERINFKLNEDTDCSMQLLKLAEMSKGLSGRSLRKIPFLAHSLYIDNKQATVNMFIKAMEQAVAQRKEDEEDSDSSLEKKFAEVKIPNGNVKD